MTKATEATTKEMHKIWDHIDVSWALVQSAVHKQWAKLTDDDVQEIRGKREILLNKVQLRYGLTTEEAERRIEKWAEHLKL